MHKFLLISLITGLLTVCGAYSSSYAAVSEDSSPALETPTLDGSTFDLATLKGKVVIVHFWATWCSSCREEMPVLDDFYLHNHTQGVEVIAVSMNSKHERDDVVTYMRAFHFPASLISDAKTNSFGMPTALPVSYIIDMHGVLRRLLTPDKTILTKQSLESIVLPLIPQ